jgi:hypothetical protein
MRLSGEESRMMGSGATVETGLTITTASKNVPRRQNLLRKRAYVLSDSLKHSRIERAAGAGPIFYVLGRAHLQVVGLSLGRTRCLVPALPLYPSIVQSRHQLYLSDYCLINVLLLLCLLCSPINNSWTAIFKTMTKR